MSLPEGFEVVSTPSVKPTKQLGLPAGFEVVSTPVHKKNLLETTDFSQKAQYSLPQNSSEDSHTSSNKVKIDVKKGKVSTAPIVNKSALSDEDIGFVPTIKEAGRIVGYNLAKHGAAFNNLIGDKEQEALRRGEMKEFEKESSILSSDSEATKMIAKMGLDPVTYTPVGLFNKGKKAWDIAKSTLAGGAIGAALTAEDELGTKGKVDPINVSLGAGLGAAINGLLSTFTHGKVRGVIPEADTVIDDVPKAQAHPVQHDEAIAKSLNEEYSTPKTTGEAFDPQTDIGLTREAPVVKDNLTTGNDIDVATKTEDVIDPKIAQAKAAQEERVRLAYEEGQTRKAQAKAEAAHKADVEAINANPRLQELIDMRRDVSAKESARPNIRTTDRQIIHENNGSGYETTVIPAMDSKNYNHDFALTQADIKAYEKNGITPALAEKFKKDLDVLDNDPMWRKVDEPSGRVEGDTYIDEFGNEEEIPFSRIKEVDNDWTAARDEWHQDSHALTKNEDGTPKIFYHGTKGNFDEFENIGVKTNGSRSGEGFYFTSDSKVANSYGKNGNVIPVHLNAKNVFTGIDSLSETQRVKYLTTEKPVNEILKDLGFDARVSGDEIVIFEPTQIKSIHNGGAFDPSNPNILHSIGESSANTHTIESMGQSLNSSMGEPLAQKLSLIMATINKADIPEAVLAKANNNPDGIHGFVYEGKAYIVADNIPKEWSVQQVRGLVMHEVGVHLRKAGDVEAFDRITARVKALADNDKRVQEAYANVPKDTEAHLIDEEALGYLVQHHPEMGVVKQLIAWARATLRKMGFEYESLALNTDDLVAMAWGAVKRGDGAVVSKDTMFMAPFGKDALIEDLTGIPQELEKFGKNYAKYKSDPKGAINHLMNVQRGQVRGALYHPEIGQIDIVWGKVTDPIEHRGYGLAHIIDKHGEEIGQQLDDIVMGGKVFKKYGNRVWLKNDELNVIVGLDYLGKEKQWVVTSFDPPHQTLADDVDLSHESYSLSREGKADEKIVHQQNPESQDALFSRTETQPQSAGGFYSVAQEAIEKMPNRMNVSAFRNYLKGKGVKNDEMVYGQIEKALEGKEVITKEEMMGAFANPVLEKKVLSKADSTEISSDRDKLTKLMDKHWLEHESGKVNPYAEELASFEDYVQNKYGVRTIAEMDKLIGDVKYQGYSLKDAGENYREELTTLPNAKQSDLVVAETYDRMNDRTNYFVTHKSMENFNEYPKTYLNKQEAQEFINSKNKKQSDYQSSHWNEPNVLYHARKQDTTINGEKTLLIEELQSDWHQAGRKQGYKIEGVEGELQKASDELWEFKQPMIEKYGDKFWKGMNDTEIDEFERLSEVFTKASYQNDLSRLGIPQAPYSKNWHEKALKDQIDEAVQKGYARVAWVDGKTSADRYSLSQSVDRLVYNKNLNVIQGYKDGSEVMYKSASEGELEALIGKEPAKRLIENEVHSGIHEIKGEALDIGGDGMKGFYDKILPDYARKYIKKWGAEVTKEKLPDGTEVWSFPVMKEMSEEVSTKGQALYAQGGGAVMGVGEDEEGNLTFDPVMAIAGAAGVSAVMSKSVRVALSHVVARSEHMSDAAIRNLVGVTLKTVDKATIGKASKLIEYIGDTPTMDDIFGHKIYKMKDYMALRENAQRSVNAVMEDAARLHLQLAELSSEARESTYRYMTGEKGIKLTPEIKQFADTFITKVDDMGKEMVDNGFLTKEAYDEWKGQYLHRRYASKIKGVNDWKSGKGEFTVDSIKMRGKTWEATKEEYQALLKNGDIGEVSKGKIEVLDGVDGKYKLRRDWTKEERKSMGEITDIAYSLPETMGRMAQMIEYGKMLKHVPEKYLYDAKEAMKRSEKSLTDLGYVKMNGSKYGALNGRWVNRSIAEDIRGVHNDVFGMDSSTMGKAWQSYIRSIKMSHTIYNPTAHVNNTVSNIVLQTGAGLNPLKAINYAKDGAVANIKHSRFQVLDGKRVSGLDANEAKELAAIEADEDFVLFKALSDRGMFGRSNLNEMLNDYMAPAVKEEAKTKIGRATKKVFVDNPQKLYQAEDDIMRFGAVKQLIHDGLWDTVEEGGAKVFKERTMSIDEAMDYVNSDIVPDYTKPMSKWARNLRDSGVMPFMSWTYHSTPVLYNQLKNHPVRFLAIMGAWTATDFGFGISPFTDDDMPEKMGATSVVIGRDGNKVTTARVSSMIPQAQIMPWNVFDTYVEPVMSLGVAGGVTAAYHNYNPYFEDKITHKKGYEGAYQQGKNVIQNVLPTPDVLDKAWNIGESKLLSDDSRKRNKVFLPRTTVQEAASFVLNTRTYDLNEQHKAARGDEKSTEKANKKWKKKVDKAINKLEKVFQ